MPFVPDIVDAEWLKTRYLYGIDLTDDLKQDYPDELFEHALKLAVSALEGELGIRMRAPKEFVERQDVLHGDDESYLLTGLDHRPVREVSKLELQLGTFAPIELPASWAHIVAPLQGQIQVIPGDEGFSSVAMTSAGQLLLTTSSSRRYTPQWLKVTYSAGIDWTDDDEADELLLGAVGLLASMLPLDTAGDLIVGAGIASKSISLDGLSQSINTTSSATNAGYGARILSYQRRLKEHVMPALNARYSALEM
jgi:hypothetical protein